MYFLSDEERRLILRRLLPEARAQGVADDLRGWRWDRPPILPIYDAPLTVDEVADSPCDTGRDVYLRRVLGVCAARARQSIERHAFQAVVTDLITGAKRLIYQYGAACLDALEGLRAQPLPVPDDGLSHEAWLALGHKLEVLRAFEARRVIERVEATLARYPTAGPDALATLALPVQVGLRLDGKFLGLSSLLHADAVLLAEGIVAQLSVSPRQERHRLLTTGYAMVLESLYERPFDIGFIVYVNVLEGRVVVERDLHIIGDELRQRFLQEREERARLVDEEIDPGLSMECPTVCPFLEHCHPSVERQPKASRRPGVANPASPASANGAVRS